MGASERTKSSSGPLLWPLGLVIIGILLLLSNYLLLGDFALVDLWPLILVVIGAQILLRGDFIPSSEVKTFGITRGSVEAATLEISSGEIDVNLQALRSTNQERLIAGQYANLARPELRVDGVHTHIRMDRSRTPWLFFSDWEMGLSKDLPWRILASSYLGQVNANLEDLIIQDAMISTGIGDIRLVAPKEAFEPLFIRSTLGNVHVTTPSGYNVRIVIHGGRFFNHHVDEGRYEEETPGIFIARDAVTGVLSVEIHIDGTFGDAYLA